MTVTLVILFNHQYNHNLPKLRQLYAARFSSIQFIVPFYTGTDDDVIAVYEHSFQFQGYIAQATRQLLQLAATHYLIIGDDVLLHPSINEHTYSKHFGLVSSHTNFVPSLTPIHTITRNWQPMLNALQLNRSLKGVEVTHILPSYEQAIALFQAQNLVFRNKASFKASFSGKNIVHLIPTLIKKKLAKKPLLRYDYPLAMSYSDVLVVSSGTLPLFAQYCGIWASLGLFVEFAIPTALILASTSTIITEAQLPQKGLTLWHAQDEAILHPYKHSLEALQQHFNADWLYIHPIKLSKWK